MIKQFIEKVSGVKIYRNSIPRGTDLVFDIRHKVGNFVPKIIFDVGAHHGETALSFSQGFPDAVIYSFEPASPNYKKLVPNCAGHSKIICENIAFGPERKKEQMHLGASSTAYSLAEKLNRSDDGSKEEVIVRTIDDYSAEKSIDEISILKIDTEGYDLEVLKGGETIINRGVVPFILVESGFDERFVPLDVHYRYLKERNYEIFGIYDQTPYWWGKNFLWNMNVLFIHRDWQ